MAHFGASLALTMVLVAQDAPRGGDEGRRPARGPRTKPVAVQVGTIHPISGPEIKNGVLLISGGAITAIGTAAEVTIPADAEVLAFPEGHAYPGLVDAGTTLYLDGPALADATTDAGSDVRSAFDPNDPDAGAVTAAGITTAYVAIRSGAAWRGQGALVRPRAGKIVPFRTGGPQGAQAPTGGAAVELRVSAGTAHPVERQKALTNLGDPFDQLEGYEKTFTEHEKALGDYKKKYEEFLSWHKARNPEAASESRPSSGPGSRALPASAPASSAPLRTPPEGAESRPAQDGAGQGRGGRGGRRGGFPPGGGPGQGPGQGPTPGNAPTTAPAAGPQAAPAGNANATPPAAGGQAPTKPTFPKEPQHDLAKDALLKIKKGDLPLRIEAQKEDELRAALKLQKDKQLKRVVLTGATEAAGLAKEIAELGVPVVLNGLATGAANADSPDEDDTDPAARLPLAKALGDAGVTLAIASGSTKAARNLPLLAANAVGQGLSEAAALRAITLSAAEVLGIARSCGSLEKGKLGDVVITSAPLLRSDARVLRVLSAGETVYESK